jgi:hypothetical protein
MRATLRRMTEAQARAFIRRQLGEYMLLGITNMTPKQRERIEALDVVDTGRKQEAVAMLDAATRFYGSPPHQRTGRHRLLNLNSGEIKHSQRAPA